MTKTKTKTSTKEKSKSSGRPIKQERQKAEIVRSEYNSANVKKKLLRVNYIGENGETLAPVEQLTSKDKCHVSIMAIIKLAHGTHMQVHDLTGKKENRYILYAGGTIKQLE